MDNENENSEDKLPDVVPASKRGKKASRALLNTAGAIPFVGGLFSAAAGYWSEREQDEVNRFF